MKNQFEYFLDKEISINPSEGQDPIRMHLKKETKKHLIGTKVPKKCFLMNRIKHPKNKILSASTGKDLAE